MKEVKELMETLVVREGSEKTCQLIATQKMLHKLVPVTTWSGEWAFQAIVGRSERGNPADPKFYDLR